MKQLIIIVLTLILNLSYSQTKGGEAIYSVKIIEQPESQLGKMYSEMFSTDVEALANEQEFILNFTNDVSVFYPKNKSGLNEIVTQAALAIIGYGYKTWIKKDVIYTYVPQSPITEECIVTGERKIKWEITTEQKTIDGYTCYKATGFDIIITPQGKEFKHPLIAWFCPEIPYSYGVLNYGGLPGLILELQTKDAVFGLKSLSLKDNIFVEELPNIPIKTEKEFEKIVNDLMQKNK